MKIQIEDLKGKSAFSYCRKMLKEEKPSEEPLEVYRGEMLAFTVSSIGWGATMTVEETAQVGPRFKKYRKPIFNGSTV